jgi:hypothetical protein
MGKTKRQRKVSAFVDVRTILGFSLRKFDLTTTKYNHLNGSYQFFKANYNGNRGERRRRKKQ